MSAFAAIKRVIRLYRNQWPQLLVPDADRASAELEAAIEFPVKLRELADRWRTERAHTYASENADHYRGYDAGLERAAHDLEVAIAACQTKEGA